MGNNSETETEIARELGSLRGRMRALAVELWLLAVVACFIIVRVLGSKLAAQVLTSSGFTHMK